LHSDTSQIRKYYRISGFVQNERGSIHENKAAFRSWVCKPLKYNSFISERRVQNQHMVTSGLCFQVHNAWNSPVLLLAVIKQCCITAGAPFWIEGELPVFIVNEVMWHTTKYGDPYSEFLLCIYPSKVHTHSVLYIYILAWYG